MPGVRTKRSKNKICFVKAFYYFYSLLIYQAIAPLTDSELLLCFSDDLYFSISFSFCAFLFLI